LVEESAVPGENHTLSNNVVSNTPRLYLNSQC
jgi:hypothetical protein